MIRWMGFAIVAAGLSLTACSSSEKKATSTTSAFVAAPDAEALVGKWSDGNTTVTFNSSNAYSWKSTRSCRVEPCQEVTSTGNYSLRHGSLYLDPSEGSNESYSFSFSNQQRTLSLSSDKGTFVFTKK